MYKGKRTQKPKSTYYSRPVQFHIPSTGYNINQINEFLLRVQNGNPDAILSYLDESGLPADVRDVGSGDPRSTETVSGDSAFHIILESSMLTPAEKLHLVEQLVARGGDINVMNRRGITPVMIAAKNQMYDMVEFMIIKGANMMATDEYGMSVLHYAIHGKKHDCPSQKKTPPLVKQGVRPPDDDMVRSVDRIAADNISSTKFNIVTEAITYYSEIFKEQHLKFELEFKEELAKIDVSLVSEAEKQRRKEELVKTTLSKITKEVMGKFNDTLVPVEIGPEDPTSWGRNGGPNIIHDPRPEMLVVQANMKFKRGIGNADRNLRERMVDIQSVIDIIMHAVRDSQRKLGQIYQTYHWIKYIYSADLVNNRIIVHFNPDTAGRSGIPYATVYDTTITELLKHDNPQEFMRVEWNNVSDTMYNNRENLNNANVWMSLPNNQNEMVIRLTEEELKYYDKDVQPIPMASFIIMGYDLNGQLIVPIPYEGNVHNPQVSFQRANEAHPGIQNFEEYQMIDYQNLMNESIPELNVNGLQVNFTFLTKAIWYASQLNVHIQRTNQKIMEMINMMSIVNNKNLYNTYHNSVYTVTDLLNALQNMSTLREEMRLVIEKSRVLHTQSRTNIMNNKRNAVKFLYDRIRKLAHDVNEALQPISSQLDTIYRHVREILGEINSFNQQVINRWLLIQRMSNTLDNTFDNYVRPLPSFPDSFSDYNTTRMSMRSIQDWVSHLMNNYVPYINDHSLLTYHTTNLAAIESARGLLVPGDHDLRNLKLRDHPLTLYGAGNFSINIRAVVGIKALPVPAPAPPAPAPVPAPAPAPAPVPAPAPAPQVPESTYDSYYVALGEYVGEFVNHSRYVFLKSILNEINIDPTQNSVFNRLKEMYQSPQTISVVRDTLLIVSIDKMIRRRILGVINAVSRNIVANIQEMRVDQIELDDPVVSLEDIGLEVSLGEISKFLMATIRKDINDINEMNQLIDADNILGKDLKHGEVFKRHNINYTTREEVDDECYKFNPKVVKLLLDHNAPINHRDHRGGTPLHIAISLQHLPNIKTLVEYHARVTEQFEEVRKHSEYTSPLEYAIGLYSSNNRLVTRGSKGFFVHSIKLSRITLRKVKTKDTKW